jgi:site-specific recombinase XerD
LILAAFFRFCLEKGYTNRLLTKGRWHPKIETSPPKYLDDHKTARVKIHAENGPLRERAILSFLLASGCRRSEVFGLDIPRVDMEEHTATVKGKGGKERQVHFNEEAALLLGEYLKTRRDHCPALFVNKHGNRLSREGIYRVTAGIGRKAKLPESLNPHCCRHTFATNLLARGADLEFIKDELGHKDLDTTLIYATIPTYQLISEYRRIKE